MRPSLLLAPLLALIALLGCREDLTTESAAPLETWFPLEVGDARIEAQVAVRMNEQRRGLMERTELAEDAGMIFVYTDADTRSFWMRNTPLPLDIGFFDRDGVLREILRLHPFDENSKASRSDQIRYALEMNQGWYFRNGVLPGAQLNLDLLAEALEARGFASGPYVD